MFSDIKKQIKPIFNTNQFSISSVTIFSIITFYIWITVKALFIFQQFSFYEVISVSFVFFTIFFTLTVIFFGDFFKQRIKINTYNILFSCIITILMIMIANTGDMDSTEYFRTFPLLETETGLGWHHDTVYHTSIIQSILNFGYPSIGQHGSPLIIYHVLSYYIDALILSITGLEAYDTYGLFVHFKNFVFISTAIVFLAYIFKGTMGYVFLIILILATPIIIGGWDATGSHTLWFTTILLILSSPKVFNMVAKDESNSINDFIFLFFLMVVIALSKVSTGFMYAVFIGIYLLLKQPKNKLVYLLGIGWMIFFLNYRKLMVQSYNSETGKLDFTRLNFVETYQYITNSPNTYLLDTQISIFATIFLLSAIAFIFRDKKNTRILIAAISSFFILVFLVRINAGFGRSDVEYFYLGFSSVLIIFTLQALSFNIKLYQVEQFSDTKTIDHRLIKVSILLSAIYLSNFHLQPKLDIVPKSLKQTDQSIKADILNFIHIDNRFLKINSILKESDKISFSKILRHPIKNYFPKEINRPLWVFRKDLLDFLSANKISKRQASLYLPKEIFEKDIAKFKGLKWGKGLLIYAVTGVPLVNAIRKPYKAYGFADYEEGGLWINKEQFQPEKTCAEISSKYIIITNSFNEPNFDLYQCKEKK